MAEAGEVLEGRGGFRLHLIQTAAETDGELLEMEATYGGDGQYPPVHMHPSQHERFEVLEGAVLTIVDGVERLFAQAHGDLAEEGVNLFEEFSDEIRLVPG